VGKAKKIVATFIPQIMSLRDAEGEEMKLIKGWKRISNQGGYVNENTGQTLIVSKKEFSENYHVLLFAGEQTNKEESKKISPEFSTKAKAEAFATNWMEKHQNGMN
jgi:hypothetical protein